MGTALAWRARTGVPSHPAGGPRSRGGAGAAWRRREGEHSPSLLSPNSDRCGTRLPRYSLREPCMVCHIAEALWRRGVTPTFPGVTSGYRAMPRCTPPRIRTGNLRHLKPTPLPVGPEGHVSCHRGYLRSASANLNRAVQGPREPSVDAGAGTSPPHLPRRGEVLEWKTGFEPAAFSLATRRATSCATSTDTHAFRPAAADLLGAA